MAHDDDTIPTPHEELPAALIAELKRLDAPRSTSELEAGFEQIDAQVAAAARAALRPADLPMRSVRTGRRWASLVAVAASVACVVWLWTEVGRGPRQDTSVALHGHVGAPPAAFDDIDRSGTVDIVDAFMLAKHLESEAEPSAQTDMDANSQLGHADVERIALAAVTLGGAHP